MRRFNKWAGNPKGTPEDPSRCIAEVWSSHLFYQCQFRRGKGPDGLFCGRHARNLADGKSMFLLEQDKHYRIRGGQR